MKLYHGQVAADEKCCLGQHIVPASFSSSCSRNTPALHLSSSQALILASTDTSPTPLLARHRQLAPSASVRVSPLCLGAMTFGDAQPERYGEMTKEAAFSILDHFYANGGNFIDTANAYQHGQSESWLGEWMAARGNRDEMVLATKYTSAYTPLPTTTTDAPGSSNNNNKPKIKSNLGGNSTKSLKLSVQTSLRRLATSYIDILYVHWWDYTTTIPELMHALNDIVAQGQVLYLGISDTPAWVVAKANAYARGAGLRPFVVYQGMWSAGLRDLERDIIPMCRDEGMGICPYGVLGQGRFQTAEGYAERERHNPGRKSFAPLSARDRQVAGVLERVAAAKGEGVRLLQVALAYVLAKTPYVFPIVGSRKVEHLQGSMDGLGVTLSEEEVSEIEGAYEFDHGFPHTFLSGSMFDGSTPRAAQAPGDVWLTKGMGEFDWVEAPKAIRPREI